MAGPKAPAGRAEPQCDERSLRGGSAGPCARGLDDRSASSAVGGSLSSSCPGTKVDVRKEFVVRPEAIPPGLLRFSTAEQAPPDSGVSMTREGFAL